MQFLFSNYLSQLLFHITNTPPWFIKSTSSELYPNYILLLTFDLFSLYLTQLVRLALAPYHILCNICVTYSRPYCTSGHQIFSNLFPKEVEGIVRGSKYPKGVPLHMLCLIAAKRILVGRFYLCVKSHNRIIYNLSTCLEPEH